MLSSEISRIIEQKNFLRYPQPGDRRAGWQKEWFHFCILSPELTLLVNLNVCGDLRPAAIPGNRVARVLMMAHTGAGWRGELETVDPRDVVLTPGEVGMVLGQNRITFQAGRLHLVAALQTQSLVADIRLKPLTNPLGLIGSPGGQGIDWMVRNSAPLGRGSYF